MNKSLIKNSILALFAIGFAIVLFTPSAADASFIKITVSAKKLNADGTLSPMSGVSVSAASDSPSDHKWWDGATCHACNTQSLSATTDADGKDAESGMACGLSDCPSPHVDNGKCGPYTITATAVASGDYDSDITYWETPAGRKWGLNGSYTTSYSEMSNGVNYPFSFTFYGRRDRLTNPSLSVTATDNNLDCSILHPNSASITLNADVDHEQRPTSPSHTIKYNYNFGDGHTSGWTTSKTATHTFDNTHFDELFAGGVNSKTLNVKVDINDSGFVIDGVAHPRTASATSTVTLNRVPQALYCGTVSATPTTGQIPLTVNFNSYVEDSWCTSACGCTPVTKYDWDFGDGTVKNDTNRNLIYTYILENVAGFNPRVTGRVGALSKVCPLGLTIRSQEWSDTNFQEVAP